MTASYEREIIANLQRAEESLEAANKLIEGHYYDLVASRAYYASFYAATAALLREGAVFAKHSGVIAAFQKIFIKEGRLDSQFGRDLRWLFELRGIGDYGQDKHVSLDDARKSVEVANGFLKAVKGLIEGK